MEAAPDTIPDKINVDFARKLIGYHCWENQRVWDLAVVSLSDAQFTREVQFLRCSVQGECQRLLETDAACLGCLLGGANEETSVGTNVGAGSANTAAASERTAIAVSWQASRRAWTQFAMELDADSLFAACACDIAGAPRKLRAWQLICHVIYHGTARRSQILRLVAELDQPVAFDLSLLQNLTGLLRA